MSRENSRSPEATPGKEWTTPKSFSPSSHSGAELKAGVDRELANLRQELELDAVPKMTSPEVGTDVGEFVRDHDVAFLGAGGENVVFEMAEYPKLVPKVQLRLLEKVMEMNRRASGGIEDQTPQAEALLDEELAASQGAHALFRQYFGEAVLRERAYKKFVPVTQATLMAAGREESAKRLLPGQVYRLKTLVRLQEKLPEVTFRSGDSFSFNTGYLETQNVGEEEYERLNTDLIDGDGTLALEYLSRYPEISKLLERVRGEPEAIQAIRQFVEQAVLFTRSTGEIIDLTGRSNVRLYKDGEAWKFVLADAVYPHSHAWVDAEATVHKAKTDVLKRDSTTTVNALNYARLLNAMAAVTGSQSRLRVHDGVGDVAIDILNDFRSSLPKKLLRKIRPETITPRAEATDVIDLGLGAKDIHGNLNETV